jgi:hypothetical protein
LGDAGVDDGNTLMGGSRSTYVQTRQQDETQGCQKTDAE